MPLLENKGEDLFKEKFLVELIIRVRRSERKIKNRLVLFSVGVLCSLGVHNLVYLKGDNLDPFTVCLKGSIQHISKHNCSKRRECVIVSRMCDI